MKRLLIALLAAAAIPTMLPAADVVKETAKAGDTNSPAVPCLLSTNKNSFFYADHLTGSSFVKFEPDGTYEMIAREHMGFLPLDGGRWNQATNGLITLKSANTNRSNRAEQKVIPMTYRDKTFLVWPEVSYKSNLQRVCQQLDAKAAPHYHEFMITEEEFKKGTASPYPFKYYKQMNKVTGAKE